MRSRNLIPSRNGRAPLVATTLLIAAMTAAMSAPALADRAAANPNDAQIAALISQIEAAIAVGNIAAPDKPAATSFLSDALALEPLASPAGTGMIRDLPSVLKQRAQQERTQGHWQTSVNFEAFADLVSTMTAANHHTPPSPPNPPPNPLPGANAPLAVATGKPSALGLAYVVNKPPEAEAPLLLPVTPKRPVATPQSDTPQQPTLAPAVITELLRRGDALIAIGDISGARRFYTLAAQNNSAEAALKLGDTYNPGFLAQHGTEGLLPDMRAARTWYQKAAEFGNEDAKTRITALARAQ